MITIRPNAAAKRVLIDMPKHMQKHKGALRDALSEIGQEVVDQTQQFIKNPPKTGRMYLYKGKPHQASAPGESPANRSGKLAKSGGYKTRNHMEMTVGETAEYAVFLENGTKKMKPRPHLIRAINKKKQGARSIILDHVDKAIKK